MLRQNKQPETENHERWLVSYADFITLLFAFFVVMYSISQVNEGKYRILSESIVAAFESPSRSRLPIQQGNINQNPSASVNPTPSPIEDGGGDSQLETESDFLSDADFAELEQQLTQQLGDLIDQDLVTITKTRDWLEVDLRSNLLFQSGSDRLNQNARLVITEIGETLAQNQQKISVRGHTDNIPITNEAFGSNWSLSAARAVAVVRLLQILGIDARRLTAEGYGEFQPVASNATIEGRAKNRRVTLAISRYSLDTDPNDRSFADESQTAASQPARTQSEQQATNRSEEEAEPEIEIVRLPDGGLLIRGKKLPQDEEQNNSEDDAKNQ